MNNPRSIEEVVILLNQVNSRLEKIEKQNLNFHGKKIINAGNAVNLQDYTTLNDVKTAIASAVLNTTTTTSDTDSLVAGNSVLHKLIHIFNGVIKAAKIGIGMTPDALIDVKDGVIRSSDGTNTPPVAGKGMEITCTGAIGYLLCYDRTGAAYIPMNIHGSTITFTGNLGFFGLTPVAQQTLNAYTTNSQSSTYTSTPAALAQAATLADLNILRVAYENLRASYDDLRTKLKITTLVA